MKRKAASALLAVLTLGALAGLAGAATVSCGGESSAGDSSTGDADGAATPDATTADGASATGDAGVGDGATRGTDGPCRLDNDCVAEQRCLFPASATCGSAGTCMTVPGNGPGCAEAGLLDPTQETSCSCDGTPRIQLCALPAGYTRGVIVHPGPCADGGQACDPTANDCPDQQICGFRVADGCSVTTAHCYDGPDPTIEIPGDLLGVCGCDGGMGTTFPDTDLYATVPALDLDSCRIVDAGPGASDASDAH